MESVSTAAVDAMVEDRTTTEVINSIKEAKRQRRINKTWMFFIFLIVLAAELVFAYYYIYKGAHIMGDATSRTSNAYYVLFLEPRKLASIGFIWNPLPSFLQLFIVPFSLLWKPIVTMGFAGYIMTSIFAGLNAALLFHYFRQAGLKIGISLLVVMLYAFNPFTFYYGANGMSETIFFTALIVGTASFALWIDDRISSRLVTVAFMLAIAFLTRYETFALMLSFGFSMLIVVYMTPDRLSPFTKKPLKMKWDYSVATGVLIFLPVLYLILLWMFLNWTIMGDPIYFLRSSYSNESQSAVALSGDFKAQVNSLWPAVKYVAVRVLPFLPPFFVIVAERIATRRILKPDFLILLVQVGVITLFHLFMLVNQKSFGWLRFYCFSLYICIAWFPYELTQLTGFIKKLTIGMLCLSLLISGTSVGYYLTQPTLGKEEYNAYKPKDDTFASQLEVAEVINKKYADSIILFDNFVMPSLAVNLDNPSNLVTNIADEVFDNAIADPQRSLVNYFVVPTTLFSDGDVGGAGTLDAINKAHPNLYLKGADWAALVFDNDRYRIYKILQWDAQVIEVADFINSETEGERPVVLYDTATAGTLAENLAYSKNAISNTSENFADAIADPKTHSVDYVVVSTPTVDKTNGVDDIAAHYPNARAKGVKWGDEVFSNDSYTVFKVRYNENERPQSEAADNTPQMQLAEYINRRQGKVLLLANAELTEDLTTFMNRPEDLITSSSKAFEDALARPRSNEVSYIILPVEHIGGEIDSVESNHPEIYQYGPDWSELVYENAQFRVYAVIYM